MAKQRRVGNQRLQRLSHEAIELVEELGAVSKAELADLLELNDNDYAQVSRRLGSRISIRAQKRTGGFRVKLTKKRAAHWEHAGDNDQPAGPDQGWQLATIDRLVSLFDAKELLDFVGGELGQALKKTREAATGQSRESNKAELARALLIKHNFVDLLRERRIREELAKKCGVPFPIRWIPGNIAAHTFVRATGLPRELAGSASPDRPADFARLEGRIELRELEGYQVEIKNELIRELDSAGGSGIATLPTGAGKTRIAVEAVRDWLTARHRVEGRKGSTVIWLAHSGELCDQAYTAFEQVWQASTSVCPLLLFRFWSDFTSDLTAHADTLGDILSQPSVLVSTPQRIQGLIAHAGADERRILENVKTSIGAIFIDEAHRAGAPTYREIIKFFREASPEVPILGLTATPFRNAFAEGDAEGAMVLKEIFKRLIESRSLGPNPRECLQEMRVLAKPVFETVQVSHPRYNAPEIPCPNELTDEQIEGYDRRLRLRVQKHGRRLILLDKIRSLCQDDSNSILYFGPSVPDADCMAFLLREAGIAAAAVHGETRVVTRRQTIADFKAGRIRVLCNCEVLTTGFDAPRVSHVVMARPTISRVLYEQMVGRGLRGPKFGGTEECLIIDCEDNYRNGRPRMGYDDFREIWKPAERRQGKWM